jgi:hypothetical protein
VCVVTVAMVMLLRDFFALRDNYLWRVCCYNRCHGNAVSHRSILSPSIGPRNYSPSSHPTAFSSPPIHHVYPSTYPCVHQFIFIYFNTVDTDMFKYKAWISVRKFLHTE